MLSAQYLAVLRTALAFTTWAFALARRTAGRMAAAIYAIPGTEITRLWQPGRGLLPDGNPSRVARDGQIPRPGRPRREPGRECLRRRQAHSVRFILGPRNPTTGKALAGGPHRST